MTTDPPTHAAAPDGRSSDGLAETGWPGFRIDVFTLFPEVIDRYGAASILGRARVRGHLDLRTHDIRDATHDVHRTVDDSPFGGGAGMVLSPEPVFEAVETVEAGPDGLPRPLLLLSASGPPLRPGDGPGVGGFARGVLAPVRALRRGGPTGGRPPVRRRALDR